MVRRRLLSMLAAIALVLSLFTLLPDTVITAYAEAGNLYVCGIKLTGSNYKDILGNGNKEAVYDPVTKTLELNGDINYTDSVIVNEMAGLTIKVNNDITLFSSSNPTVSCQAADTVITGKGKLTAISSTNAAIFVMDCTLRIRDANICAKGLWGIAGCPNNEYLNITTSTVSAEGNNGAICDFKNGISTGDCYVTSPEKSKILKNNHGNYSICDRNGNTAAKVNIVPPYNLWLAGTRITAQNQDDILGDGTAYFDYENKFIHLDHTTAIGEGAYGYYGLRNTDCEGLTLIIDDDSTITSYNGIYTTVDMTITGNGLLTLAGEKQTVGICVENNAALTINQAYVYVKGTDFAFLGTKGSTLKIRQSELTAESQTDINYYSAICGFDSLTLESDRFVEPEGAYYKNKNVFSGDNKLVASIKIEKVTRLVGDLNGDGSITADDAIIAARLAAGYSDYSTRYDSDVADMNRDGKVTADDAIIIARYSAGYGDYRDKYTHYI